MSTTRALPDDGSMLEPRSLIALGARTSRRPASRGTARPGDVLRLAATGLLAVSLVVTGCGNDDDTKADSASDTPTTAAAGAGKGEFAAFCDAVVAADVAVATVQGGDGPPDESAVAAATEAMSKVGDAAPDEIADTVDSMVSAGMEMFQSETGEPGEDLAASSAIVYEWVGDNCGFSVVDVTAKDYSYEGMPHDLSAGKAVISLTNAGTEFHEMMFVRVNDGVTLTTDELLNLPEDEAMTKIEMKGGVFAMPGEDAYSTVDLDAGRYLVVCFIPVGLTPEAAAAAETGGEVPEGPPHFTQGMVHEITIT